MIILGIDPGIAIVGWGVLEYSGNKFKVLGYGSIQTPATMATEDRLCAVYSELREIIDKYKPEELSIERLYFNSNTTTAIDVAQARGVIVLACESRGVKINEYTPLQVKQSVTGYGKAEKRQVMEMVKNLLGLKTVPKPDDTADALALAVLLWYSCSELLLTDCSSGRRALVFSS